MAKIRYNRSEGAIFEDNFTPEQVRDTFEQINDFSKSSFPEDQLSAMQIIGGIAEKDSLKAKF